MVGSTQRLARSIVQAWERANQKLGTDFKTIPVNWTWVERTADSSSSELNLVAPQLEDITSGDISELNTLGGGSFLIFFLNELAYEHDGIDQHALTDLRSPAAMFAIDYLRLLTSDQSRRGRRRRPFQHALSAAADPYFRPVDRNGKMHEPRCDQDLARTAFDVMNQLGTGLRHHQDAGHRTIYNAWDPAGDAFIRSALWPTSRSTREELVYLASIEAEVDHPDKLGAMSLDILDLIRSPDTIAARLNKELET